MGGGGSYEGSGRCNTQCKVVVYLLLHQQPLGRNKVYTEIEKKTQVLQQIPHIQFKASQTFGNRRTIRIVDDAHFGSIDNARSYYTFFSQQMKHDHWCPWI